MFFDEKMDGTLTLKKKKPNRIKKIDDTGIIVQTEKGEDEISIKTLEED